jgi:glucose/arabinose dehydrogenase
VRRITFAGLLFVAACASGDLASQVFDSQHGQFRVVTVARGLDHPWAVAFLPDGRMLVTERPGRMRIVSPDGTLSPPLAGVPPVAATGQGGLLDVVLDPGFADNQQIWFTYSEPGEGGQGTALARARLTANGLENVEVRFQQLPKVDGGQHFGSRIVFSRDGKLFLTLGERGRRDWSQDLSRHMGKVIRLMPDGSVPPDNPFAGRENARPEIWSYGHRNPQSAALHPETGVLWTVEHGAMGGDEINIPQAGRNYGWPVISYGKDYSGARIGEGTSKSGMEQPIHYWDPSIAPSGMAFYTGDRFPRWKGNLFVGSLKFGLLVRLELEGEKVVKEERLLERLDQRIRDVRQGPDGLLYLLTDEGNGQLLRLEPAG